MEDYKKKYEEALDNFKKIKAANKDNKELVDFIEYKYPELKESKDEKIGKQLLNWFKDCKWDAIDNETLKRDDIIAWLEKRVGQKFTLSEEDYNEIGVIACHLDNIGNEAMANSLLCIRDKYNNVKPKREWSKEEKARINKIIDVLDWAEEKGRISYSDWEDYVCYVKSLKPQSNQKSVWNEEDKKKIDLLIAIFEVNHPNEQFKANPINTSNMEYVSTEEIIDWLKSLKERYTWKPSNEQIKALSAINVTGGVSYAGQAQELINLYNDLKNLREE